MPNVLKPLILACLVVLTAGCTDPDNAVKVLKNSGFTDIKAGGYAWVTCSDNDTFATKFTAISPTGQPVSGAVCRGWFKGSTIRFEQ